MQNIDLKAVIGFTGDVPGGLVVHPSNKYVLYPLGSTVVIRDVGSPQSQRFLRGHSDAVSCIAVSPSGRYVASGQVTYMGFQADAIVWDFETGEIVHRLNLHKVKVESLAFAPNEQFLATLGGQDDNNLVIWDVESGTAICGSPAANDQALCVGFFNNDSYKLVTGGALNLRIWEIDSVNRKLKPFECNLGQQRRVITSMLLDVNDDFMYLGTQTGDIIEVSMSNGLLQRMTAPCDKFSRGVTSMSRSPAGDIVVGAGDGSIVLVKKRTFRPIASTSVMGSVTSLTALSGDYFYAGTAQSNIYRVRADDLAAEMRSTCHFGKINAVAYPYAYSEVFATCAVEDIRVWNARTCTELLRIRVPNLDCECIAFMKDGKAVVSGWSDGTIRAFAPQSGKLLFTIGDAHQGGVTALTTTNDCERVISGGADGQVRVWRIGRDSQVMVASMKEHKQRVNSLIVRGNDLEAVSASSDGCCIIWDLQRFVRKGNVNGNTFFKCVVFSDDESQLLTCGTDRKIAYWDPTDGSTIRELYDEEAAAELNALAISTDGTQFISGGADRQVKLWSYDEGYCGAVGEGHSGSITDLKISPDSQSFVSVGDEGTHCQHSCFCLPAWLSCLSAASTPLLFRLHLTLCSWCRGDPGLGGAAVGMSSRKNVKIGETMRGMILLDQRDDGLRCANLVGKWMHMLCLYFATLPAPNTPPLTKVAAPRTCAFPFASSPQDPQSPRS